MKLKKLIIMLLLAAPFCTHAQQIARGEYFIDTDPGTGNGTTLPGFTVDDSVIQTINLNTTGLSQGFHRIYYRYKYTTGSWGIPEDRLFYIYDTTHPITASLASVSEGEYFVDTDPGPGNGIDLPGFATNDSVMQTINFNTTGLSTGFHRVYYRYKNTADSWGIPEDRLFYIYDTTHPVIVSQLQIVSGEYFVDTDPGVGNGTSLSSFSPADSIVQMETVTTSAALPPGSHVIHFRYKDQNGSWGEAEARMFQVENCNLNVTASASDTEICQGTSTLISASVAGSSFQWYNGTVPVSTSSGSYSANAAGAYEVVVTDSIGCIDTSNVVTISVNPLPVVTLDLSTHHITCYSGGPINLMGESPAGGMYSGPGITGSTFDPFIAGLGTHTIMYSYTDGNSCVNSVTDTIKVETCTGINEKANSGLFSVYPNPTSGTFTLSIPSETAEVIITDLLGQQLLKITTMQKITDLWIGENGIYLIYAKTKNGVFKEKLIINH